MSAFSEFEGLGRAEEAATRKRRRNAKHGFDPVRLAAWLFILLVVVGGAISAGVWAYRSYQDAVEDERELLELLIHVDGAGKAAHRIREMWAVNAYEKAVQETTPRIQAIYRKRPAWRKNPPDSCKPFIPKWPPAPE